MSKTLRALLAAGGLVVAPGAYDPYTARLVESLGFSAVYLGGNAIGTRLCTSEPLTTLTETVDSARQVAAAINVPLVVDADAGFGDALHAFRAVREFENAGVAAIHIEDQPFPKRAHYHRGQGRVTELNEVLEKLTAALEARRNPDFMIIGRTDMFRVTGSLRDTVSRCAAYIDAGVDMLMPLGLGPAEARTLRDEFPTIPILWLEGIGAPELSLDDIAEIGASLVIYPVIVPIVMTKAVIDVYQRLRDTGLLGLDQDFIVSSRAKILEFLGMNEYWGIEERTTERHAAPR